mmetsp:Transcript_66293/g.103522  ORF Transcript_66293/g.103522 Transcript_66293/m.103522 type:complete len:281 (-) Transcript_66293:736-1578(-)
MAAATSSPSIASNRCFVACATARCFLDVSRASFCFRASSTALEQTPASAAQLIADSKPSTPAVATADLSTLAATLETCSFRAESCKFRFLSRALSSNTLSSDIAAARSMATLNLSTSSPCIADFKASDSCASKHLTSHSTSSTLCLLTALAIRLLCTLLLLATIIADVNSSKSVPEIAHSNLLHASCRDSSSSASRISRNRARAWCNLSSATPTFAATASARDIFPMSVLSIAVSSFSEASAIVCARSASFHAITVLCAASMVFAETPACCACKIADVQR